MVENFDESGLGKFKVNIILIVHAALLVIHIYGNVARKSLYRGMRMHSLMHCN